MGAFVDCSSGRDNWTKTSFYLMYVVGVHAIYSFGRKEGKKGKRLISSAK